MTMKMTTIELVKTLNFETFFSFMISILEFSPFKNTTVYYYYYYYFVTKYGQFCFLVARLCVYCCWFYTPTQSNLVGPFVLIVVHNIM